MTSSNLYDFKQENIIIVIFGILCKGMRKFLVLEKLSGTFAALATLEESLAFSFEIIVLILFSIISLSLLRESLKFDAVYRTLLFLP